jgi:glucokinase
MNNYPSELRDISFNQLTGEMITDLAKKGDTVALKAFDYTGEVFGKAIANLVACFTSEVIILFGGLVESGDLLI